MSVQRVLVIGAGIGGLAAAAALGRRGSTVDVVEVRPDSPVLGVGINQPGNSLRALDALGLLEECLAAGYAFDGNDFCDWHGQRIVQVPSALGDDRVPANAALARPDLHRILRSAAERAGATLRYGVTVEALQEGPEGADVVLTDGSCAQYDLVAAFDGVGSPTRRRLFGEDVVASPSGYGVWRMQLPRPSSVVRTTVFQGDRAKAGLIPLSATEMYLFLVVPEPGDPRHDPREFGDLLRQRLTGSTGIVGDIRDGIDGPAGIVYSPLTELMLPPPWHRGRVVVLGDAAHTAAPHLTQGAGMAIEDAIVLADEVLQDRPLEESLAAVTALRHDRTKLVVDVSHAILEAEMAITAATMAEAVVGMREQLPGQTAFLEAQLNLPFRSPAATGALSA